MIHIKQVVPIRGNKNKNKNIENQSLSASDNEYESKKKKYLSSEKNIFNTYI